MCIYNINLLISTYRERILNVFICSWDVFETVIPQALFRALKARSGRTPKYGLLFHSSFIGRVQQQKHKGRMSR